MITYVTLFLPKICVKAKYIFGTEACACLDTSRRVLRSAEPKHTPRNKKEQRANPKPSGAELCAEPLAQLPAAALGAAFGSLRFHLPSALSGGFFVVKSRALLAL